LKAGAPKPGVRSKRATQRIDTRTRLIQAAAADFNERGFHGTDSNRIARRAGFAPQTFYRWFADKLSVFIAVYQVWEETERELLSGLIARQASAKNIVDAAVQHHRNYLVFRRSLRQLSAEDQAVRRARAESRKRQIAKIRLWLQNPAADEARIAAALLQMERLADALAERELEDMGLSPRAAARAFADLIDNLRAR
jgi:AcrR family transcriptional regulator